MAVEIIDFPEMNQTEFIEEAGREKSDRVSIIFCTEKIVVNGTEIACMLPNATEGSLIYNIIYQYEDSTEFNTVPTQRTEVMMFKYLIDNAMLEYWDDSSSLSPQRIQIELQSYPSRDRVFTRNNVLATGSMYFVITPLLILSFLFLEIVKEKSEFIKIYLDLNGAPQRSYWMSWIIVGLVFSAICAAVTPLIGYLFGMQEFTRIPILAQLMLFFLTNLCCTMIGAIMAAVVNDQKLAFSITLALILVGLVMQILICNQLMIIYLYLVNSSWWVLFARALMLSYPPFNFAMIYYRAMRVAGLHFSYVDRMWVDGRELTWSDLTDERIGSFAGSDYVLPSCMYNYLYLFLFLIFSSLLLTYLELVVSGNRAKQL